jgi:hypothetical protein
VLCFITFCNMTHHVVVKSYYFFSFYLSHFFFISQLVSACKSFCFTSMFFSLILCLFAFSCSAYINDVDRVPSLSALSALSASNLFELKMKVAGSNTSYPSSPPSVPDRYEKLFYSFDETTASPLSSYYGGYGNSMTTNGDYLFISSVSTSSSSLPATASPSPPSHSLTTTSKIYVYRRVVNSKTWELITTITDPSVPSDGLAPL